MANPHLNQAPVGALSRSRPDFCSLAARALETPVRGSEAPNLTGAVCTLACPRCAAVLTVRLFLPGTWCWQCGADLELLAVEPPPADLGSGAPWATEYRPLPATAAHRRQRMPRRVAATWESLPARLASGLAHLVFFLGLALIEIRAARPQAWQLILLATNSDRGWEKNGEGTDLAVPPITMLPTTPIPAITAVPPPDPVPLRELPKAKLEKRLQDPAAHQRFLAARDPRVRQAVLASEGGSPQTEAAVRLGLLWLAQHQFPDGRWSLDEFHHAPPRHGLCLGRGRIKSDVAATALSLLPFLGAGEDLEQGEFRDVIRRGLTWLVQQQQPSGDLRGDSPVEAGIYAHGQAAIVLCESFAMTRAPELQLPAQRAVDFIVALQDSGGGWRYEPGEPGDTSVLGWQLMALQSARAAGLPVPPSTFANIEKFLATVAYQQDALYAYQPHHFPSPTMTAEALLSRVFLGWSPEHRSLQDGATWLLKNHHPSQEDFDIYYLYYGTQLFHQLGGTVWNDWNQAAREVLLDRQHRAGHMAGSWDPLGPHAHQGGRVYVTSLALCCLEVYYRHAPIFRPLRLSANKSAP